VFNWMAEIKYGVKDYSRSMVEVDSMNTIGVYIVRRHGWMNTPTSDS
jgi:hypothetical protein